MAFRARLRGAVPRRDLSRALAAGFAGWALARLAGADELLSIGAPAAALLPFTPQAAAGAWLTALLVKDKRASALAAVAATALTVAIVPRAIPGRQPPATGPTLRVLTANLLIGRAGAAPVVDLIRRTRTDVFFVQELGAGAEARLSRAGIGEFLPYVITDLAASEPRGNAIYSRYPLATEPDAMPTSSVQPVAALKLPSGSVRVACVHLHTPKRPWQRSGVSSWREDLASVAALPMPVWPGDVPVILAGDFNATLDHAGFRRLRRLGLADAACQAGLGLVPTWGPLPGGRGALLTLDHVLVDARCAVQAVSVHPLPGTDHRALFARVRLP
jgi:endonuclease/exonuclease/phosphatase (EEP) superfamily protein YafD